MSQFTHIIAPVDGSTISFSAVKKAAQLAKAFDAKLTLISLIGENPYNDTDFYTPPAALMRDYYIQAHENAENALKEAYVKAEEEGIEATLRIIKGKVNAESVSSVAEEQHADLIVMGSHGRKGIQKMLLGSFAQDVLNSTKLPVLIVRE